MVIEMGLGVTGERVFFRECFFTKNNLIVFGKLVNQLMFRNYATWRENDILYRVTR